MLVIVLKKALHAPHTCLGGGSGGVASCWCCPSGTPTTAPPAPDGGAVRCGSGGAAGCCGGGMLGLMSI